MPDSPHRPPAIRQLVSGMPSTKPLAAYATPSVQLVPTPAAAPAWDGVSALPTLHDGFFYALLQKTR